MKIENIVTSPETSKILNRAGFNHKSIFSYYKNSSGELFVGETDLKSNSDFESYCYTSSELLSFLPVELEVNENTYIPSFKSYHKIIFEEGQTYNYAQFELLKSDVYEFVTRYVYNGKAIAFGQNLDGNYRNLVRFGNNDAEAVANMILALIEEEIILN